MVLNGISQVFIASFHSQNFVFFKKTNEDRFCLSCRFAEETWLAGGQPLSIGVQLLPFVVTRIEQDGVSRFNILGKRMLETKLIQNSMEFDVQKHLCQLSFHFSCTFASNESIIECEK